jgi:hypothetical protein
VAEEDLVNARLFIDGFNVLTTVEAALGGAVIIVGRDGCYRDLAGVHGSYRRVEETTPAIGYVGATLASIGTSASVWYLDRPVSNSGRLKRILEECAATNGWDWTVELAMNPDKPLGESIECIATADGPILDRARRWLNLARLTIDRFVPAARTVEVFPRVPGSFSVRVRNEE